MKRRLVRAEAALPPDKRRGALSLAALALSGAAQAVTLGDVEEAEKALRKLARKEKPE